MDCHDIKERLSEYIDGMLSDEEASMVKDHLAYCTDCKDTYESMLRIIEHMSQMERIEEPEAFLENVRARLERRFSFKGLIRRLFVPIRVKIPLELAGVVAAALLIFHFSGFREDRALYEITISMGNARTPRVIERKAEKRETADRRGKKGSPEGVSLQEVISSLGGRVMKTEYREGTDIPTSMIVEIRADTHQILLQELGRLGVVQKSSGISEHSSGLIRVKIMFEYPDS